ncbi:MAG: DUF4149 domain-containing protein [Gammaproteobacteria bacterium]|nr:MAG: DUF4149 domain-containing protein [Gammaproteobacteria bacterium]
MLLNIQRIVLTLWIGGLWAVGYLVAPVLFHHLQNPQLAGQLAAELFTLISWFGLASVLVLTVIYSFLGRKKWRFLVLFLMAALIAINLLYLTPEITGLREMAGVAIEKGSEIHNRFAILHGIASGLYLLVSLLGLLLVIRQPDEAARLVVSE